MNDRDLEFLIHILNMDTKSLGEYIVEEWGFINNGNVYIAGNSNSNVVVYAHIDTINKKYYGELEKELYPLMIAYDDDTGILKLGYDDNYVKCLGGDDRAGVFILLKLREIFQNSLLYLLIDNEESRGLEEAMKLIDDSLYTNKIVFAFDRRGREIVLDYIKNRNLVRLLARFFDGYRFVMKENNRFSILDYMNEKYLDGTNIGVGYYREHTPLEIINTLYTYKTLSCAINLLYAIKI